MTYLNRLPAALVALLILAGSTARGSDSSTLRIPLENTGIDADAAGVLEATLNRGKSRLRLELEDLAPNANFSLVAAGEVQATLTTDESGRARVKLETPKKGDLPLLKFDPRTATVQVINSAGQVLLQAAIGTGDEPDGSRVSERVVLTRTSAASAGKAQVRFDLKADGRRILKVQVERLTAPQTYAIFVNGIQIGQISVPLTGAETKIELAPGSADPRGAQIDLTVNNVVHFTGELAARARGINYAEPTISVDLLDRGPAYVSGTAKAKLRVDERARREFEVELEGAPAGAYDLFVDGVLKGTFQVAAVTGGTRGEIEFSSDPDDDDELPLDFKPNGAQLSVRAAGTTAVHFTGTFDPGSGGTDQPGELEEELTSTGRDPNASGDAKYEIRDDGERKFDVEIEDVAVGQYTLRVGGIVRGRFSATLQNDQVKGEIQFSVGGDDADELPLTFDPRGQLIEVSGASGVLFSHLFGSGSGGGGRISPLEFERAFLATSSAPAGATAKLDYQRDERGRENFEVEIEDAPVGNYALFVDGIQRGTINVITVTGGTRGQIEFDDEPDANEQPLDFPVLEKVVQIRSGETLLFQRLVSPQS